MKTKAPIFLTLTPRITANTFRTSVALKRGLHSQIERVDSGYRVSIENGMLVEFRYGTAPAISDDGYLFGSFLD